MVDDLRDERVATLCDGWQCEQQERGKVVLIPAGRVQRRPVLFCVLVVVVGEADHDHIVDVRLSQHEGFQRAGGAPVAVAKGMHRADVVVGSHRLNDAVMLGEFRGDCAREPVEGGQAAIASCDAPTARHPKDDVVSIGSVAPGTQWSSSQPVTMRR